MKIFVAIANQIYEIDRLPNAKTVYTVAENITIYEQLIIIIEINYFILLMHIRNKVK
jgi:hypothetical protein